MRKTQKKNVRGLFRIDLNQQGHSKVPCEIEETLRRGVCGIKHGIKTHLGFIRPSELQELCRLSNCSVNEIEEVLWLKKKSS